MTESTKIAEGRNDDANAAPEKDVIRDNGPRIVGAMKFIPDFFLFMSGLKDTTNNPFRSVAAAGFMLSRSMLLVHGTKDRKTAGGAKESDADKNDHSFGGVIKHNLFKITHPGQYPVESGAGIATLAGVSVALSGAAQMRHKNTWVEGAIELGVGIFTALAEGNVLFSAEKPKKPKTEAVAKTSDNLIDTLKNQPVLLSGITQAVVSGSQIALGALIFRRKRRENPSIKFNWSYLAAGTIYTAADLVYAFMVRKNEFHKKEETLPEPVAGEPAAPESAMAQGPSQLVSGPQRTGVVSPATPALAAGAS